MFLCKLKLLVIAKDSEQACQSISPQLLYLQDKHYVHWFQFLQFTMRWSMQSIDLYYRFSCIHTLYLFLTSTCRISESPAGGLLHAQWITFTARKSSKPITTSNIVYNNKNKKMVQPAVVTQAMISVWVQVSAEMLLFF